MNGTQMLFDRTSTANTEYIGTAASGVGTDDEHLIGCCYQWSHCKSSYYGYKKFAATYEISSSISSDTLKFYYGIDESNLNYEGTITVSSNSLVATGNTIKYNKTSKQERKCAYEFVARYSPRKNAAGRFSCCNRNRKGLKK